MFKQTGASTDTKVAVLEEKVSIYEQMMKKIEDAIYAINETSQGISKMLAIHEERLEQSTKSDGIVIKMIDEVKHQNTAEHQIVIKRIEIIEKTVVELSKFKWQALSLTGAAIVIVGLIIPFIDNMLEIKYDGNPSQVQIKK
jgi:uncharacterized membrane protein